MYKHPCLLDSLDNCTLVLPHFGHFTLIAINFPLFLFYLILSYFMLFVNIYCDFIL